MADFEEHLPETVDEQDQRLIHDLRLMYRTDDQKAHHLARIQQRLSNSDISKNAQSYRLTANTQHIDASNGNVKPSHATIVQGRFWQHRLSMVAAVLFAALLVSSLLLVLNRAHQSSIGTSGNTAKPAGGLNTVFSLHMLDTTTGWALNEHGVLRTTDGGSHWKNVTPPSTILTRESITDFLTASIASIATPQTNNAQTTQVLHTADGGQTWQRATIQVPFPRQISFIDSQHGWLLSSWQQPGGAAEPVSVFRTTDGGKVWMNVATALFSDATPPGRLPYGGQKTGIRFRNTSTGWVTGTVTVNDLAWLYVTHDAGSTWNQQTLPLPSGVPSAQLSIISPTFFSATDGILPVTFSDLVTGSGIATDIYTTHDGGSSWQSSTPVHAALSILDVLDMQHGWATDGTMLYSTSDGGQHWTKLSPSTSFKQVTHLNFVSSTVGWAISRQGNSSSFLLKTIDGGQTWTPNSPTIS